MTGPLTLGQAPTAGALYYGDCLDWMSKWDSSIVDLVYLDPPFNSKSNYNMLYAADVAGDAQYRAFADTWIWDDGAQDRLDGYLNAVGRPTRKAIESLWRLLGPSGMLAYLTYMAERLDECHRLLKPTGSIYLHCDPTASHYLKVLMDAIFGPDNFRSEVIWHRSQGFKRKTARKFPQKHDTLLVYSGSSSVAFNTQYRPHKPEYVKRFKKDADGRLYRDDVNPTRGGRRRIYLDETRGDIIDSVWMDINPVNPMAKERLGYPTQKPRALLERIIEASSNPGDLVLDPFCGCGTAVDAARRLGRRWVGIDISSFAVDVMLERLGDRTIPTYGIPYDLHSARRMAADDPFGFESWAVSRLRGFVPNTKQVADGGVDGRARLAVQPDDWDTRLALAQVKGGKHAPIDGLRAFCSVTDQRRAALGCYVTVEPFDTDSAKRVRARPAKIHIGGYPYERLNRWSIADYFDQRPPPLYRP